MYIPTIYTKLKTTNHNIGLTRTFFSCNKLILYNYKYTLLTLKELRIYSNKIKFSYPYILATWWCKPLILQTLTIGSSRIHSLKYHRWTTLSFKYIGTKNHNITQFLYLHFLYVKTKIGSILRAHILWDLIWPQRKSVNVYEW